MTAADGRLSSSVPVSAGSCLDSALEKLELDMERAQVAFKVSLVEYLLDRDAAAADDSKTKSCGCGNRSNGTSPSSIEQDMLELSRALEEYVAEVARDIEDKYWGCADHASQLPRCSVEDELVELVQGDLSKLDAQATKGASAVPVVVGGTSHWDQREVPGDYTKFFDVPDDVEAPKAKLMSQNRLADYLLELSSVSDGPKDEDDEDDYQTGVEEESDEKSWSDDSEESDEKEDSELTDSSQTDTDSDQTGTSSDTSSSEVEAQGWWRGNLLYRLWDSSQDDELPPTSKQQQASLKSKKCSSSRVPAQAVEQHSRGTSAFAVEQALGKLLQQNVGDQACSELKVTPLRDDTEALTVVISKQGVVAGIEKAGMDLVSPTDFHVSMDKTEEEVRQEMRELLQGMIRAMTDPSFEPVFVERGLFHVRKCAAEGLDPSCIPAQILDALRHGKRPESMLADSSPQFFDALGDDDGGVSNNFHAGPERGLQVQVSREELTKMVNAEVSRCIKEHELMKQTAASEGAKRDGAEADGFPLAGCSPVMMHASDKSTTTRHQVEDDEAGDAFQVGHREEGGDGAFEQLLKLLEIPDRKQLQLVVSEAAVVEESSFNCPPDFGSKVLEVGGDRDLHHAEQQCCGDAAQRNHTSVAELKRMVTEVLEDFADAEARRCIEKASSILVPERKKESHTGSGDLISCWEDCSALDWRGTAWQHAAAEENWCTLPEHSSTVQKEEDWCLMLDAAAAELHEQSKLELEALVRQQLKAMETGGKHVPVTFADGVVGGTDEMAELEAVQQEDAIPDSCVPEKKLELEAVLHIPQRLIETLEASDKHVEDLALGDHVAVAAVLDAAAAGILIPDKQLELQQQQQTLKIEEQVLQHQVSHGASVTAVKTVELAAVQRIPVQHEQILKTEDVQHRESEVQAVLVDDTALVPCCVNNGSKAAAAAENAGGITKFVEEIQQRLPPDRKMAIVENGYFVEEGGDLCAGDKSRWLAAYYEEEKRSNLLRELELACNMKKLELKHQQIQLQASSTEIGKQMLDVKRDSLRFRFTKAQDKATIAACIALRQATSDYFIAALFVMTGYTAYRAWSNAPVWYNGLVKQCTDATTDTASSKSWFQLFSWKKEAKAVASYYVCMAKGTSRFGLGSVLGVPLILICKRMLTCCSSSTPMTAFVLGCYVIGAVGRNAVNLTGGDGDRWWWVWMALCTVHTCMHIFTSFFVWLLGKSRIGKLVFHFFLAVVMPVGAGLLAFPSLVPASSLPWL